MQSQQYVSFQYVNFDCPYATVPFFYLRATATYATFFSSHQWRGGIKSVPSAQHCCTVNTHDSYHQSNVRRARFVRTTKNKNTYTKKHILSSVVSGNRVYSKFLLMGLFIFSSKYIIVGKIKSMFSGTSKWYD